MRTTTQLALAAIALILPMAIVLRSGGGDRRSSAVDDGWAGPDAATALEGAIGVRPRAGTAAPTGRRLARASEEVYENAEEALTRAFGPGGMGFLEQSLLGEELFCGPFLWTEMRDDVMLANVRSEPVQLAAFRGLAGLAGLVGNDERASIEARAFHGDGLAAFVDALAAHHSDVYEPTIAEPTAADHAAASTTIPFRTAGPVFVLESGARRVLVRFDEGGRLVWVDDYSELGLR